MGLRELVVYVLLMFGSYDYIVCMRRSSFEFGAVTLGVVLQVVISICEDLPATAKLAKKLSQGITDIDSLAPEVKDRMDHLLQTWQTVDLDPRKSRLEMV